ncbi:hypothetical protein [Staphylococcus chromogenes]|uniref:hypothetical protein n=1 Tax=Staphylococcus chromogenes TaxID=46126 RepID=UPI0028853A9C|nr:hypothetical protein [Staphylococcus chromogenes]MDT0700407.1 hypothetical protein [Staphylococcus chromogenes]
MKLYTLLNLDRTKRLVTSERKAFKLELKNMIESIILLRLEKCLVENKDNKK